MKKNKLLKTGALALGTVASIAAPIAAVVSCGSTAGRYDGQDDKKIVIGSTYQKDKTQWNALAAQVAAYNAVNKDGYKVELQSVDYKVGNAGEMRQTYESQDKNKMKNLYIGYPDDLGVVTKYDMEVDLSKTTPAVDLSKYSSTYTNVNKKIGGLDASGTYFAPITKSVDVLTESKPVLKQIFKIAADKGLIDGTVPKIKAVLDATTVKDADAEAAKNFVAKSSTATPATKFGDEIFTDTEKLFDFLVAVTDYVDLKNGAQILGVDSAVNLIYSMVSSKLGGNDDDFLFKKDSDGYITYQFKSTKSKEAFDAVYSDVVKLLNNKTLFFGHSENGKKKYSSDLLVDLKLGLSLGSSAGYSHWFAPDSVPSKLHQSDIAVAKAPSKFGDGSKETYLLEGPGIYATHVIKTEDNETAKFLQWFIGNKSGAIAAPAAADAPVNTFDNAASYINPTKDFLSTVSGKGNLAQQKALETLKGITGAIDGFDNPVDDTTADTRKQLELAMGRQYVQASQASGHVFTTDELYSELGKLLPSFK